MGVSGEIHLFILDVCTRCGLPIGTLSKSQGVWGWPAQQVCGLKTSASEWPEVGRGGFATQPALQGIKRKPGKAGLQSP